MSEAHLTKREDAKTQRMFFKTQRHGETEDFIWRILNAKVAKTQSLK